MMEIEFVKETFGSTIYNIKEVYYFLDSNVVVAGVQPITLNHPQIIVSPNPFNNTATLEIKDGVQSSLERCVFVMYDMLGEEVKRMDVTGNKLQIEKDNLQNGMYFYRVNNENYTIGTGKFIIE